MKKFFGNVFFALMAMVISMGLAVADANYPYTNPTYVPSAISPAKSFSAPGTYAVTLQNGAIAGFAISGTCTSLAATVQVSIDGTNFYAINVYPVATGTITAAASISATGGYRANVSGAKAVRLNITALTAACSVSAVVTTGGPSLVQ